MRIPLYKLLILSACFGVFNGCSTDPDSREEEKIHTEVEDSAESLETAHSETSLGNLYIDMHKRGVHFMALGNEPFWSFSIEKGKRMEFKTPDGQPVIVPYVEPEYAQDANVRRYRAITEAHEIIVQVTKGDCSDTMSDRTYPYKVTVDVRTTAETELTHYSGCGLYAVDPRLHNIWAVESIDGVVYTHSDFEKGIPTLELNINTGTVLGHDGCNNLRSTFSAEGNEITFGPFSGTLMACPSAELSSQVGKVLSQKTLEFRLGQRLELVQNGKVRMTLRHVD